MVLRRSVFALIACGFLFTALPAFARDNLVLQLRWDHQFQFAGYYAAKWLGYYDEAGLTVDIRSAFEPDGKFHSVTKEVAEGRADFGTAGADILKAQDKGAPLVIVKSIFQQSPVAFYSRAGTNLKSPADLVRLRVGTRPGGIASVELRAMLRAESIDPTLVRQRPIQGNLGIRDIAMGLLDVASGFTISAGWYARQLRLNLTALHPQTYGVDFYGDALFTHRKWIEQNPDLVQKFANASLKGWEYALTHPKEIADRISRELSRKVPINDLAGFNNFQTKPVHRLTQFPIVQLGHTNPTRWQRMHDALKDAGLVTGDFSADQAIFDIAKLKKAAFERNVALAASVVGVLIVAGIVGWIVSLRRNLRARRKIEATLRENEAQLRAITDNSPSMIFLRDADSKHLKVNKTYQQFYGITRGQAVGRSGREWLGDATAQRLIDGDRKILATGIPSETEHESVDSAGQAHFMRTIRYPVRNEDGTVIAVGGTSIDITEHKQAQNELERQKSFFETLVENIPAMVTMRDIDGKYVFVNRRICDAFNVPPDQVIGKTTKEIFGIDPDGLFSEISGRAVATGEPVIGLERKSGLSEGKTVSSTFVPIKGPDGTVDFLLTISFDITEQRQREEQLRQSQKMEAVGQLTGGVAHDFNNLLTVVLGNLELLSDRISDDAIARSFADTAIAGARRGADLTHRLLAFSRKQALVPVVIEPRKLVDGLHDLMRRTLGETIDVNVSGGAGLWCCEADPSQLESAILNLAINARDAMPDGGTLSITMENADLDDSTSASLADVSPGQYVSIAVTDTGSGIAADAIDHVFEPFFTTKEIGKGSGLGLSMVYGFVKQSGGHVTIYSEAGVGTTVKMYLPKSAARTDEALREEREAEPRARGETILLVEDDADVRALVVAQLSDLGYDIVEAQDAQSALPVLDGADRVDVLLTDVILPGGTSGPKLAEEVKRRRPDISVIFMSGYSDDAMIHQGRLEQGIEFLSKPFRKIDLARTMRNVLDRPTT